MNKVTRCVGTDGKFCGWMIDCPACGYSHLFDDRWTFDGNLKNPTFSPSMHVTSSEPDPDNPGKQRSTTCHSFVENGQIRYLSDCTHKFKGQTVDL